MEQHRISLFLVAVCLSAGVRTSSGSEFPALRTRTTKDIRLDGVLETKSPEELYEELKRDVELMEKVEASGEDTRESRHFLKKLSFLAGIKMGGIIQSSGTFAASNSLRIFGKIMNSAVSVSYGSVTDHQPLPTVPEQGPFFPPYGPHSTMSEKEENVGSTEKEQRIVNVKPAPTTATTITTTEDPLNLIKYYFVKKHNAQVERFNQKFLKDRFTGRDSG